MEKKKPETQDRTPNLIDSPYYKIFAKNYLDHLGNSNPTHQQLAKTQALLSHTWIRQSICVDLCLNQHEKQCLLLSAQGKGLKEMAALLNVSIRKITQYRQSILQKLSCKKMTSAIIVGIRYGEIKAADLSTEG